MKKLTAIILAVVMVFSMATTALAASVTPEFSTTAVEAGQDVTVTLTLDEAIENVVSMDYRLYFDANLFTLKSSENGTAHSAMQISNLKTDTKGTSYMVSFVDTTSEGQTIAAGTLYTLTFTAKADMTEEQSAAFELVSKGVYSPTFSTIDVPVANASITVTVSPEAAVEGYTVTMPADISIVTGETASIPVMVGNAEAAVYNAFDMSFTYDASALKLTSTEIEGMTVTDENGTVRVQRYGTDLSVASAAFTLTFEALGAGETTVTAAEAKVGIAENAHELDAADATILDDATVITIAGYSVTLPDDFIGESTVTPGEDYNFTAKDENYDYEVTAKIGDTEITVTDNGDGTFTIPADQINGNIVISTEKSGKIFDVVLGDDMTGEPSAQYMTPYTATLTKEDGYTYDLKVEIGGNDYTGFAYDDATGVVTIPGADITGAIKFKSNKTQVQPSEYTVTFEGSGAGEATGEDKVAAGADYTFTLNMAEGYTYTVSYKMGDSTEAVELTEADGKYTIENVSGDLVITIAKEYDLVVEVNDYVTLNGKAMFLVTATATVDTGKVLSYDGTPMYYSNQYNAWSFLVITETTLSDEDAKALITLNEGTKVELNQTYNVNETANDTVDINDAQLVFNMYNNEYQDFSVATMVKFLKADVNNTKKIDVNDAAAIVAEIVKAK